MIVTYKNDIEQYVWVFGHNPEPSRVLLMKTSGCFFLYPSGDVLKPPGPANSSNNPKVQGPNFRIFRIYKVTL